MGERLRDNRGMTIPEDVLERITATVLELVETPEVERFLLASAVDPANESAALGADAVVDVFRSDDAEEVAAVFEHLRDRFESHGKAQALSIDTSRPAAHVYVALWAVADIPEP